MNSSLFSFFGHRHGGAELAAGRGGRGRGPFGGGMFGNPFGSGMFGGGPPGGGGFFRGGGSRARRGDVRTAVLLLLAEQARNGYQLMQEIEQRSEGAWRPSPGSMYPALQQLEDEGLVRVEAEGGSRLFHLTEKGKKAASEKSASKEPAPWAPSNFGTESVGELRELFHQVAMATMQVNHVGTPAQVAAARKILAEARRSLYQLLAEADGDEGER
ncbi:MAG: helix-turn-helix transcriptional regulator [Myxococcales bacterium]|mgnify:CR=1 FL=1|nr:helix-turn-helix transcriptional regulator [Myxococcales bacterium]